LSIRVLLDQNVPMAVGHWLFSQRPRWLIQHVGEVRLWGASDQTILDWAQDNGSIVLTFDEDFADTRMYPVGSHCGVIRLRVWPTTTERAIGALERLLAVVPEADIQGSLVIVDDRRIRVRRAIQHG
jgi:predicted nuclease of predicted toxin-antitoxin system